MQLPMAAFPGFPAARRPLCRLIFLLPVFFFVLGLPSVCRDIQTCGTDNTELFQSRRRVCPGGADIP